MAEPAKEKMAAVEVIAVHSFIPRLSLVLICFNSRSGTVNDEIKWVPTTCTHWCAPLAAGSARQLVYRSGSAMRWAWDAAWRQLGESHTWFSRPFGQIGRRNVWMTLHCPHTPIPSYCNKGKGRWLPFRALQWNPVADNTAKALPLVFGQDKLWREQYEEQQSKCPAT